LLKLTCTLPLAAIAAVALAMPAAAAEDVVTNIDSPSPLPAGSAWSTLPGENTGTAEITNAQARSGNGSIELTGDRTRVQTGYQYANAAGGLSNLGPLSSIQGLSFDWMVASDSSRVNYTPALRLLVQDGTQRSELIWEGAYNGYGTAASQTPVVAGQWYSSNLGDNFWQFVAGVGPSEPGGALKTVSLTEWASSYSANAFIAGFSVGAGSSAGAGYHAFVDNVRFQTSGIDTTYNFEVGAVPEPATWAMLIVGFGAVGVAARRRSRAATTALA